MVYPKKVTTNAAAAWRWPVLDLEHLSWSNGVLLFFTVCLIAIFVYCYGEK
jgi:hypothetical protein